MGVTDLNRTNYSGDAVRFDFFGAKHVHVSACFFQVTDHLPMHIFQRCSQRYRGERYVKRFRCFSQSQDGIRTTDLSGKPTRYRSLSAKLYHMDIRPWIVHSILSDASEQRNWCIYADFAQTLIRVARTLYAKEDLDLELDNTVYALDILLSGTRAFYGLRLCRFPTAFHPAHCRRFLRYPRQIPYSILCQRCYSTSLKGNQTSVATAKDDLQPLRHIKYCDKNTEKTFIFLTNNFVIPAQTVADLYRYHWQVKLFFKWIKQHRRIKSFFGTSENAVKTQIWIAISVCVLVATTKKLLNISTCLYTILQISSLTLFEKMPLEQIPANCDYKSEECDRVIS